MAHDGLVPRGQTCLAVFNSGSAQERNNGLRDIKAHCFAMFFQMLKYLLQDTSFVYWCIWGQTTRPVCSQRTAAKTARTPAGNGFLASFNIIPASV
jgi:hypothetical protein